MSATFPQGEKTKMRRIVACAATFAAMCAVSVTIANSSYLQASGVLDFVALSVTLTAMAIGFSAWAAWGFARRFRSPAPQLALTFLTVICVIALSGAALAAWAYSDPEANYARKYGGTEQCLEGTPYDIENAELSVEKEDSLRVTDKHGGNPALNFDEASKGGLLASDSRTRAVIDSYGC
ncbi:MULTISPECIES: hypothetical protein [Streptomyces]|uniref:hypothetical protein n=1 Tax=Streptomyces TaxID=1883 RepID=UPI00332B0A9E